MKKIKIWKCSTGHKTFKPSSPHKDKRTKRNRTKSVQTRNSINEWS